VSHSFEGSNSRRCLVGVAHKALVSMRRVTSTQTVIHLYSGRAVAVSGINGDPL
jgi:hypothetical protein